MSVDTIVQFGRDLLGFGSVLLGIIFWFRGLRADITEIKDNHLATIEENTGQMKDDLRELVGYLRAKSEDGKI